LPPASTLFFTSTNGRREASALSPCLPAFLSSLPPSPSLPSFLALPSSRLDVHFDVDACFPQPPKEPLQALAIFALGGIEQHVLCLLCCWRWWWWWLVL